MSKITPILTIANSRNITPDNVILEETTPDNIVLELSGQGPQGPRGPVGNGIEKIEKTATSGLVDTYTIYFTNGNTFSYEITNGKVFYYDGEYTVTPKANEEQTLATSELVMREDVTVTKIPYYITSNTTGNTAIIGD